MEFLEKGEQNFNEIYAFLNTKRVMKDGRRRSFSTTAPQLVNILGKNREFTNTKNIKISGMDGYSNHHTMSFWGLAQ